MESSIPTHKYWFNLFFKKHFFFFFLKSGSFFLKKNKRRIFHYNKLKLQQNDIKTKNVTQYWNLYYSCKVWKIQKSKQKVDKKNIRQKKNNLKEHTQNKTKRKKKKRKREREVNKKKVTHPIFPNDFSHATYCFFIKISWAQSIYANEIMLFLSCHFF